MVTVASYFDINTDSAEREVETAAQSIFRSHFRVLNLIDVTFSDFSEKPIRIPDTASRPADVTYSTNTVDCRTFKIR